MASIAMPDSSDSNLPKEPGNKVCDIINCVAIKGAIGNAFLRKEKFRAQVSRQLRSLKETVRFGYFLNLMYFVLDFLGLVSPFIMMHIYSRRVSGKSGLIWGDFHALCAML